MSTAKTDQTGRVPRLIRVFAGRICRFVGFVMRRLICRSTGTGWKRQHHCYNVIFYRLSLWTDVQLIYALLSFNMSLRMTKPTKWPVRRAKTQISLGICPVWSVFAVRMKKPCVLSYSLRAQQRLWSDWVDAQADLSLCWAHKSSCWFCHACGGSYLGHGDGTSVYGLIRKKGGASDP